MASTIAGPGQQGETVNVSSATELQPPVAVLIVDDQPPFRSVAGTVVSMIAGWSVVAEAASGEEAVSAAAEQRPDVVLMDINLPGINGIEATRQIVSSGAGARVVLLSTYQADDLPADAMQSGAISYLRKEDLTPAELRRAVRGQSPAEPE